MSYYSKAVKNISFNYINLILNVIISFFLSPFVVHSLGNTYYGIWAIMMQFTGYLYLFDFGVRESVLRYVSKYNATENHDKINQYINAALIIYSAVFIASTSLTVALSYLFPHIIDIPSETVQVARVVVLITGINVSQTFIFNVFAGIVMGLQRNDLSIKVGIVFAIIRVVLIVYFLNKGYGIIALGIIQFLVNLGSNIGTFFIARHLLSFRLFSVFPKKDIYKKIINYGGLVLLNNVCEKIIHFTDTIVIGIFLNASAVTFYAIAGSLINYVRRFVRSFSHALTPLFSELKEKGETGKIINVLTQGSRFALLVGLPPSIVYIFEGRQFISLWMGSEYSRLSGDVLIILTITHLFSAPHYTINSILYGISKHHIIAYCRTFEAIANILLSIILIGPLGIAGVALGTAIPHLLVAMVVLPVAVSKSIQYPLLQYIKNAYIGPLSATIPFILLTYYFSKYHPPQNLFWLFTQVLGTLPIYFLSVWYIAFNTAERQTLLGHIFKKYKKPA